MGFKFISWTVWSFCQGAAPQVLSCFQSRRISMNGTAAGEHRGGAERVQNWWSTSQRPWTRLRTHCNERLQVKLCGRGCILCDTPKLLMPRQWKHTWGGGGEGGGEKWHTRDTGAEDSCDSCEGMLQLIEKQGTAQRGWQDFSILLFPVEGYKGGGQTRKDWEMSGIRVYDMKFRKNQ